MLSVAGSTLNSYWTSAFGIPDRAAFHQAVEPLEELLFPTILGKPARAAFEDFAALGPTGGPGMAVQGYLAAHPWQGTSQGDAANAVISQIGNSGIAETIEGTPMGQLVIPDCFQISIQMEAGGHRVENVIGVRNAVGNVADAVDAVQVSWELAHGPLYILSSLVSMTNYHGVDIGSGSGAIVDKASSAAGNDSAAQIATRASAALVKWNGSSRDRSTRGRMYLGPLQEGSIDADGASLSSGFSGVLTTAIDDFLNSLTFLDYPLVVLSRTKSIATVVTSHSEEPIIATQRRRLRS